MKMIAEINDIYGNTLFKLYKSTAIARKNQIRMHRHTLFEISLVLTGNGKYLTEHGTETIGAGDVFLFSGNEYHCITDIDPGENGKDMELLNIQFNSHFVLSDSEAYADSFMDIFFKRRQDFRNKVSALPDNPTCLADGILKIREECECARPCYRSAVKADLIRLLVMLYRDFSLTDRNGETAQSIRHADEINRAVGYMNAHFSEPLTLTDIVGVSALSKSTFATMFRRLYNMTPWDYLNIKRVEKALSLLKNTDMTVLSVATECGYNNTANFNRIFKKVTGITPKMYRGH